MATNFIKWFETILEEKQLPYEGWQIEVDGVTHLIDTDVVIEHIKIAPISEQKQIKDVIVKIDFVNGNVNHFFKHLAQALAANYAARA
jgi:hypothetical protein